MMFRPRRIWKRCRLLILTIGGLVALALLAFYVSVRLLPAAKQQIGIQKSVDRLQSWNKASRNRLRALCDAQPIVSWTAKRQLWIPPVCPHVVIYAGEEPNRLVGTANETSLRQLVKNNLESNAFHIYVQDQSSFATLGQITGSDFPEKHWPSVVVLEQRTGNKFLWEPPSSEVTDGKKGESFGAFLQKLLIGEWPQYLKQETLDDLPVNGGTSPDYAPMHINSDFFEKYIANSTARATILPEKELFVVFHAPWCGHCRVFLSKFEPLALQILKVSKASIGFYKFDITANDVTDPKYRFSQVPTTLFFGQNPEPIELMERRDVRIGVIDFLRANSHTLRQKDYNEL